MSEIRVTDPTTGGQKGAKIQRYDLIPIHELDAVGTVLCGYAPSWRPDVDQAIGYACSFWHTGDRKLLLSAGAAAIRIIRRDLEDLFTFDVSGIPMCVMEELATIYGFGATKYDDDNWKKGYNWGLSYGAMMRHAAEYARGNVNDHESGRHHMAHFLWHVITLLWFMDHKPEMDKRDWLAA